MSVHGWLAWPGVDLDSACAERVRAAVASERLRFARDLHDLLGQSLAVVAFKAELANRLLATEPQRAPELLAEIGELTRRAIADARSVARGHAELRLDDELYLARTVLATAEIDVRVSRPGFAIPERHERVLATVAREGVTNVLRHSNAAHCEISVRRHRGRVQLEIVNDGLAARGRFAPCGGDGIRNMAHRLREVQGHLAAGVRPDGRYRLRASVPLPVPAPG